MNKEFATHTLNRDGLAKAKLIAAALDECLVKLEGLCPVSREFSIARTKLEEAGFFCKKSMASLPEHQITTPVAIRDVSFLERPFPGPAGSAR